MWRQRIWSCGVLLASGPACNAKIARFDATPRQVCPGDRVELTWDFTGSGTMTVAPPTAHAPTGQVPSHGTAAIYPVAPTTVALHVTRAVGAPTGARLDIELARPVIVAASVADPSASCQGGAVASTAHVKDVAADLAVAVVGVRPGDDRAYDVSRLDERTHQVVTARVSSAAPTTRFAGLPLAGDWRISSPLPPGASCDSPGLPSNLVVVAYTRCPGDAPVEVSHDAR